MKRAKVIDKNDEMFGFEGDILDDVEFKDHIAVYFDDVGGVLVYRKDQIEISEE